MARLPNSGGDVGVWGDILNDYLAVSHESDGAIRLSALPIDTDTTLAANSDVRIPSQKAAKTYIDASVAASTPDATATVKGKVKLAGDLAGTADLPTVPALTGKQAKVTVVVGPSDADYITDGTADNVQINSAINDVNAAGGGTVLIKQGTYAIAGQITIKSNVTVIGAGKGVTILQGGVGSGYTLYTSGSTTIANFKLRDLTIDCNNVANAAGMRLNNATNCVVDRVTFKNVAAQGWHLVLGSESVLGTVTCFNNKFIDCDFDTKAGTLEMLLIFDCDNTQIIRPYFTGNAGGPIFGLYQKTYNTKVVDAVFKNNAGFCIYYSLSCDDMTFINPYFENSGMGFEGANMSDNGAFGETFCRRLKIINPTFVGGANSTGSTAIQLGAVNDATIVNPSIEEYEIGIVIHDGNLVSGVPATNWSIVNPHIRNCNPNNNFHVLHPGILFMSIGGSLYGRIIGGDFYDDQATKTQRYPIGFTGAFTWDNIEIHNNRLLADVANGGTSIVLSDSAALGSNVRIFLNTDYSGSTPAETGAITSDPTKVSKAGDTMTGTLAVTAITSTTASNALQLGTGGGDTRNVINLGGGGSMIGQVNGHTRIRSSFAGKQVQFMDAGDAAITNSIDLDTGSITLGVAGGGILVKEGSNATMGIATLVGGTVVVSTTKVTANSRIQLTAQNLGTVVTPSALAVSARTAGVSFTILASQGTDTSTIAWQIFEPAP